MPLRVQIKRTNWRCFARMSDDTSSFDISPRTIADILPISRTGPWHTGQESSPTRSSCPNDRRQLSHQRYVFPRDSSLCIGVIASQSILALARPAALLQKHRDPAQDKRRVADGNSEFRKWANLLAEGAGCTALKPAPRPGVRRRRLLACLVGPDLHAVG